LAPAGRGGARARAGVGSTQHAGRHLALSDLLLLDAGGDPPSTLADAIPRARPSTRLRAGERVALFWEVYGLTPADTAATVTLAVARKRPGWLRRGAEALRLAHRPAPVRLRWAARADDPRAVRSGSLTLGLDELGPGTHRIELTVRTAAGDSASSARTVVVER
jgi:hypothetical protein